MNLRTHFYIFGILFLVLGAPGVRASENPIYNNTLSLSSLEKLNVFTTKKLQQNIRTFDIAETDLNGDSLNEFIVRPKNCPQTELCLHMILGETPDSVIDLGEIDALRVVLGNDYEHGVRNLLVFDRPENDFAFTLYRWNPDKSRYAGATP